jgi:hypothetical protein
MGLVFGVILALFCLIVAGRESDTSLWCVFWAFIAGVFAGAPT